MNCIDLTSNWQKCRVLSQNIQNNAKLQKWSKYNDLHRFDVKMIKTTQNYQIDQITMNCMHLTSNWQKCRVLSQNIQNNAKLQKWSKYNDLNRFDVELAKMSSFVTKHSKQRKTPKVIKIQWLCIDLISKWSKQRKTTKSIKLRWIALIWRRIGKNVEFCHKTFKTTQNSKSDQNTMTCIDLMLKWSKQRKTTKSIKLRWIACIWRRIGKNVELCHKTFKTTQNSKSDQNTMTWIDLMSNWQKCRVLSQNIQNNAKLQKWSKYNDLHRFDVKMIKTTQNYQSDQITMNCMHLTSNWQICRVLSQNIQYNAKLQKWSKYNDLNRFDVELSKMSSFIKKHSKQRKTPKVIKIQWLCIDLMSKWSKQRKTTKAIKLRWIACIWRRIGKYVEFCHKTFNTTQNSKSDQNTMTWIDLMSNCQKCRVLSKNIQNNAKLQKWSKYNDFASIWCQNDQNNAKLPNRSNYDELHWFDVELAKMSSFVTKHSKQRKTPKVIKIQWLASIWC